MSDLKTAATLALEALEINLVFLRNVKPFKGQEELASDCVAMTEETITSLRQAIAEAEKQEPVAHFGSAYVNENGVHVTTVLGPVAIPQDAKLYTRPQPKREPPTPREVKDTLRATGLLTNSQAWDAAEEVMKLLAAHGITSDMKQEHVDKTAKQRHEENT
jgi:hypothetical protein